MRNMQKTPAAALFSLLMLCGHFAAPQKSLSPPPPPPPPQQLPVYIVEFTQALGPELDRDFEQLSRFTTGLVQLRLLQIPSVTVRRVPDARPCNGAQTSARQSTQTAAADTSPSGDFYLVEGSIKPDLPEITLNYSVKKCEAGTLQTVFQDIQPFTLDRAFDEITIVAHAIAFKIERVTPPTLVEVPLFTVASDAQPPKGMTADLQKSIIAALESSSGYRVAAPADYKIVGELSIQKQHILGALPGHISSVSAQLRVEAHAKSYPLRSIHGSGDQLPKFYQDVSEEIARRLPEVLVGEHYQISGFLEGMKTEELIDEANQLLEQCPAATAQCGSAQDVITLLSSAARQDKAPWRLVAVLGKAQLRSGHADDAAASFQRAQRGVDDQLKAGDEISLADQVDLLNQLGDAYRSLSRFDRALETYSSSLKLNKSQAAVYKSTASCFESQGDRVKALETLVDGLKTLGSDADAQLLHDSAKDMVLSIQDPKVIDPAGNLLSDAFNAGAPVANEYALLIVRKWSLVLDGGWKPEQKETSQKELQTAQDLHLTDPEVLAWIYGTAARVALQSGNSAGVRDFVAKAEQLDSSKVPAFMREWIERISAQGYTEEAEYQQAIDAADRAYHILATDQGTYLMADATLLLAQCQQVIWTHGESAPKSTECKRDDLMRFDIAIGEVKLTAAQQEEIRKLYVDAASRSGILVAKRFQSGDYVFMRANHALGKDRQTVDQYLRLTQQDAGDQLAWNIVMYVCSQYLFDFDCAFKAAQKSEMSLPKSGPSTARDYINIAETAVLSGDHATARKWLDFAAGQPGLSAEDTSLLHLYRLWTIMLAGNSDQFKIDFDAWHDAAGQFRSQSSSIGWIFIGARMALARSKVSMGESKVSLLVSMIDALEDRDSALPAWPPNGLL